MKMHTGIQKKFKKRFDGTFQEYIVQLIFMEDALGNKSVKHDKTIEGSIYKVAAPNELSLYGEVVFLDPDDGQEKRLIPIKLSTKSY